PVIFLDASVLLAAEDAEDRHHLAAVALTEQAALGTLDLALYEVTIVANLRWGDPAAARRLRDRVWLIDELGSLTRIDARLGERAAELCATHQISAYDAAYVAAAERQGALLASCDERDLVSRGLAQLPGSLVG